MQFSPCEFMALSLEHLCFGCSIIHSNNAHYTLGSQWSSADWSACSGSQSSRFEKQIQNLTVYKLDFASLSFRTFLRAEISLPKEKEAQRGERAFPGGWEALLCGIAPALGCKRNRRVPFCNPSAITDSS